jgi:hypothetical protein
MSALIQVDQLTPQHFEQHPIWQFALESEADEGECAVRPLTRLPASHLNGRVVGLLVRFAGGQEVWAMLGNVDCKSTKLNQHFLGGSFWIDDRWVPLARYHDPDHHLNGPDALAEAFTLPIEEVFPIRYDLRRVVRGSDEALVGVFEREPKQRLTGEELILLALEVARA